MLKRFANGNELLDFIACDAPVVPEHDRAVPLTWAMVVIQKDDRFLLLYNFNRGQWECAGGGLEAGETVEQAAIREVLEETSQHVIDLRCHGIFKFWRADQDLTEYGALYSGSIDELRAFIVNTESDRILLWHPREPLEGRLSELSAWMMARVTGSDALGKLVNPR